jgi:hypothetical protein
MTDGFLHVALLAVLQHLRAEDDGRNRAEDGEDGKDRNEVFHVEYPLNRCSSLMRRPSDHKRLADASTDARR